MAAYPEGGYLNEAAMPTLKNPEPSIIERLFHAEELAQIQGKEISELIQRLSHLERRVG